MTTASSDEIGRLMHALESDAEECWPLYEEVGRIFVSWLLEHDPPKMSGIVEAWAASSHAQGVLADTWPDSAQYSQMQLEAATADAALFALIRKAIHRQGE
jgi:hypothetical protein